MSTGYPQNYQNPPPQYQQNPPPPPQYYQQPINYQTGPQPQPQVIYIQDNPSSSNNFNNMNPQQQP